MTAGDELTVVHKPDHDITVTTMFRAMTTERYLLAATARARRRPGAEPARGRRAVRRPSLTR